MCNGTAAGGRARARSWPVCFTRRFSHDQGRALPRKRSESHGLLVSNVIASGGVSRREDVVRLNELVREFANLDGVIVGKALYEKRVELPDLLALAKG